MNRQRRIGTPHHVRGGRRRAFGLDAVTLIHLGKLLSFGGGVHVQLAAFDVDLARDEFVLRRHRHPFAGGHAGGSGDGAGNTRESHDIGVHATAGEADHQ